MERTDNIRSAGVRFRHQEKKCTVEMGGRRHCVGTPCRICFGLSRFWSIVCLFFNIFWLRPCPYGKYFIYRYYYSHTTNLISQWLFDRCTFYSHPSGKPSPCRVGRPLSPCATHFDFEPYLAACILSGTA